MVDSLVTAMAIIGACVTGRWLGLNVVGPIIVFVGIIMTDRCSPIEAASELRHFMRERAEAKRRLAAEAKRWAV